jgi:hypothetical protein
MIIMYFYRVLFRLMVLEVSKLRKHTLPNIPEITNSGEKHVLRHFSLVSQFPVTQKPKGAD